MKIIVKKVGEEPNVIELESLDLEKMQSLVGGYIECLSVSPTVDMWLNDEGKLHGLPTNMFLCKENGEVLDTIQGDVFFASNSDGETVGLSDDEVEWVKDKLVRRSLITVDPLGKFGVFPVWTC